MASWNRGNCYDEQQLRIRIEQSPPISSSIGMFLFHC